MFKERFDITNKQLDELTGKMRATNLRLAGLQHRTQQPRLVTETDVETDTKARKRTAGAAAERVKHGDTSSIRVDRDPTSLTSFGKMAELF